ncbi:MAG: hypothetical protein H6748_01165 [Spirochaetaceae bacterium]|nr:hypothetical protein [Myxococcales bacterium]MCB9722638.1 hypothetical protein [Spirochaetaceae bacterium]
MELSIFGLTVSLLESEGAIPAGVHSLDRAPHDGVSSTRVTGSAVALLAWCRATERVVIEKELREARVFAGFERFSRAAFVARRFAKIASLGCSLDVVGEADAPLAFHTTRTVPIERGPLMREWFLLVDSNRYRGLLAARDLDGFGSGRSPRERRFEGVITHRGPVVRGVADALEEWIGFQLG